MWHHPAHHAKRTLHIISKDQCGKYASTTWDSSHVHLYHMHNPEANKWETQQPCSIHGQHGPPKKSVHANLFKKRLCTQTLLKKGPRATLDKPFFVVPKKNGCNVLNQILYPNVNSQWWIPQKKKQTKSSTESWNEHWSPITFVDTIQTSLWETKKGAIWRNYKSTSFKR